MSKQAMIIGLGQFGLSLAKALAEKGVEVLAVDSDPELVRQAATVVDEAISFDATDETALGRTAPGRRDVCICGIGGDSKEASIICTALLRQQGAKRIIARANDPLHERILRLVGAHEVVNPERDFGERLANRLVYEGIIGEMPLGPMLVVTELKLPPKLAGQTLIDLKLPSKYGITVVAVRQEGAGDIRIPQAQDPLTENDVLVIVSRRGAVGKWLEGMGR